MDSRGVRALRGIAAASVSTLVAAFSHSAGGGTFPSFAILALTFAFTALICVALTGRRMSAARIALSVLLSQALFHLVLSLPMGSATAMTSTGPHGHPVSVDLPPMARMDSHLTGDMLFAHLIAALITAAGLIWGERMFWGLLESARLALSVLLRWAVPIVGSPTVAVPVDRRRVASVSTVVLSSIRRRGPPAHPAFQL